MKNLYTAKANSTGGRRGMVRTADSRFSFKLTHYEDKNPVATSTNPEELFACGFAACFGNTVDFIARLPISVNASVDLNQNGEEDFTLDVILNVTLPNLDQTIAEQIVQKAQQICPYSRAMRGETNITIRTNHQIIRDESKATKSFVSQG